MQLWLICGLVGSGMVCSGCVVVQVWFSFGTAVCGMLVYGSALVQI